MIDILKYFGVTGSRGKSAFDNGEDFVLGHDQQVFAIDFHGVAAGVRAENNFVTHFHGQRANFAVVQDATGADSDDFAAVGFSAAEPGRTIPPAVFDSSSLRRMTTRSCRGRSFIVDLSKLWFSSAGVDTGGLMLSGVAGVARVGEPPV
jgi:hypothetical protein